MPEERKESKAMSMLERIGVVRKVDASDSASSNVPARNDSNIKPLFVPPKDTEKVTPAARQPIPGMPKPVLPTNKKAEVDASTPNAPQADKVAEAETDITRERIAFEQSVYTEALRQEEHKADYAAAVRSAPLPPQDASSPRSSSSLNSLNLFRNVGDKPSEDFSMPSSATLPSPLPPPERAPQPENYTDRFLNTEELYDALALKSKKTDSIYLIEEYLQTLPESLPDSQRREIVGKLLAASDFDYDLLMGDGVLRVKMLKEYAERFARHTDDYIAALQEDLDEMEQQILRTRKLIENRKELHKKQFFSIEAEAQRLKDILTFISG